MAQIARKTVISDAHRLVWGTQGLEPEQTMEDKDRNEVEIL